MSELTKEQWKYLDRLINETLDFTLSCQLASINHLRDALDLPKVSMDNFQRKYV